MNAQDIINGYDDSWLDIEASALNAVAENVEFDNVSEDDLYELANEVEQSEYYQKVKDAYRADKERRAREEQITPFHVIDERRI